jgi:transposase InsO family protein
LAGLEDVCSRRIVGWAMDEHLQTELVERALQLALGQRQPAQGLLHHSGRGSQYAAHNYRQLLTQRKILVSMSRPGNCYDNAMKESFFATLKTEYASRPFATRAEARTAIFEYIEVFYNRQRLHSGLGLGLAISVQSSLRANSIYLFYDSTNLYPVQLNKKHKPASSILSGCMHLIATSRPGLQGHSLRQGYALKFHASFTVA